MKIGSDKSIIFSKKSSNIPRFVRTARRPRSQQDNTPERRRTGQERIDMRVEAPEEEAPGQGDSLPESEPAAGNTRERRRAHGREEAASGRAGRLSSLERLRQRCEASPNNRGLQRTLERLEERQDNNRRRSTRLTSRNSRPVAENDGWPVWSACRRDRRQGGPAGGNRPCDRGGIAPCQSTLAQLRGRGARRSQPHYRGPSA